MFSCGRAGNGTTPKNKKKGISRFLALKDEKMGRATYVRILYSRGRFLIFSETKRKPGERVCSGHWARFKKRLRGTVAKPTLEASIQPADLEASYGVVAGCAETEETYSGKGNGRFGVTPWLGARVCAALRFACWSGPGKP